MFRRGVALCAASVLGIASVANAGAVITLTQLTPAPVGGFIGGETVQFSAAIATSQPLDARLITLDFAASSPELIFLGPDSNGNGTPEFTFSLVPPLIADALYSKFPDFPLANVTYASGTLTPGFILALSATPLTLGTGSVRLPLEPGTYLVDALNADSGTDNNNSARLDFDFASPKTWIANDFPGRVDTITGAPLSLTVVPEPATLVLLGLGGLAALRRRKA